jgi:PAS domain S-box-containing protein
MAPRSERALSLASAAARASAREPWGSASALLFQSNPQPMWVFDAATLRFLAVNDAAVAHYGYSRDEFLRMTIDDLRPPEDVMGVRAMLRDRRPYVGFWRHRRRDGTIIYVDVTTQAIEYEGRTAQLVVSTDVTGRRRAEERLAYQANLLANLQDGVIATDAAGRIVFWNRLAYEMYGRLADEAIGRPFDEIVTAGIAGAAPPPLATVTSVHRSVVEYGRDSHMRVFESTIVALRGEDGLVSGHLIVSRDITDRKLAEHQSDDLLARLASAGARLRRLSRRLLEVQEAERRHLARELHDEIGQSLTALKINLQSIRPSVARTRGRDAILRSLALVDATLEKVRGLSLDLRPSLLDHLGLAATLQWYLERQAALGGFTFTLDAEPRDRRLPPEIETSCFRIAQEALTNVVRHSHARHVEIHVRDVRGALELHVLDDGRGFDPAAARERAAAGESLGLIGMQERAELAGGRLDVTSSPEGTRVTARFPLPKDAAGAEGQT